MLKLRYVALTLAATALLACAASADVVNVDIEAGAPNDSTHVGDDGPLSTPGQTLWTSITSAAPAMDLPTETGAPSPFDIVYAGVAQGSTFNDPGINNLQDSGDFGQFEIRDLLPGQMYTLAVYCGQNGGFLFNDLNGQSGHFFTHPGNDGWSLPGTEGNDGDYFLVRAVEPKELSPGVWGVEISPDGVITGLQISGMVPEPASLVLLAVGGLLAVRRR